MNGTILNVVLVAAGSIIGILIKSKISDRFSNMFFSVIGVFTIFIGIRNALAANDILVIVISIIIGSLAGEALRLEERMYKFSEIIKAKIKITDKRFSDGLLTAFLIFCMGSMTVLGAFEEGAGNYPSILYSKSVMDGFTSVVLSSALGIGVLFSIIPLFLYQGILTLFSSYISVYMTAEMIRNITAVGGLMLIALGIDILELRKIKVMNMLPSLIIVIIIESIRSLMF